MSNTFLTPTAVISDSALFLADNLLTANLCNREIEGVFAKKVGDTVAVKTPPVLTASEFVTTTSAATVTETSVDVVLQKHFYVKVDITADELTLQVDDFNTQIMMPAVNALVAAIDNYALAKFVGGFARNMVGTAGNEASTHQHILDTEQEIYTNISGNTTNLVSVITPTTHTNFAKLNIFGSADFGAGRPQGLADNSLGKLANVNYFRSPYAGDMDQGDIAGSVLATGTAAASTVAFASLTEATGTIYEGTQFVVAGDATVYTSTADATIAANAATIYVTPVLATSPSGAAVTFETAPKENIIYNPAGCAGAIVPAAVTGSDTASATVKGLGLSILVGTSTDNLTTSWVFHTYAGFKVVQNLFGAVMQG